MIEPITIALEGHLPSEMTLQYVHLPFEVPPGTGRLEVEYDYDAAIGSDPGLMGGNTLDIGIFDPRGINFLKAGYRGWSGSARSHFFISTSTATPGYMPGPIQTGIWHICLGPYKVSPNGCQYRVSIRLFPDDQDTDVHFPPRLKIDPVKRATPSSDGWYKGELHCHTVNSDGDSTVEEIVLQAEALGLDFLAVTDHNNLTHQVDLARIQSRLLLIPGLEVTTYYGHWNIWGEGDWIDFRVQTADDMIRAIADANRRGYLVSCNHPRPMGPDWAFPEVQGYACVEVWNGPWELLNTACLTFWEARLAEGERLSAVGGSDHHFSHEEHIARLGHPTTFIYSPHPPTTRDVLSSIRSGRICVSESPQGPRVWVATSGAQMGDQVPRPATDRVRIDVTVADGEGTVLEVIGASGLLERLAVTNPIATFTLSVSLNKSPYIRAQVLDVKRLNLRAISNPIYFV
ncbi:MAG: CehA/McbA family metallohydrolase [Anaerolineae bacterium]|nr:CehA/McbA family metallohydrolase [Anaerolineae bacterium]